jgi:hypothetical protein
MMSLLGIAIIILLAGISPFAERPINPYFPNADGYRTSSDIIAP